MYDFSSYIWFEYWIVKMSELNLIADKFLWSLTQYVTL